MELEDLIFSVKLDGTKTFCVTVIDGCTRDSVSIYAWACPRCGDINWQIGRLPQGEVKRINYHCFTCGHNMMQDFEGVRKAQRAE